MAAVDAERDGREVWVDEEVRVGIGRIQILSRRRLCYSSALSFIRS